MPVPANIYHHDVDFTALALQFPAFAKKLKGNGQLNFSDPEAVRELTNALLQRDFSLSIDLPDDRLCPPVPNRFNYILFVQSLIDSSQFNYSNRHDPSQEVIGLDIGTGASAIYPLLACRQHPAWKFLATEIDPKSIEYAKKNIVSNDLQSQIKVIKIEPTSGRLIPSGELASVNDIRVQITNPPFYSSEQEMVQSAKEKSRPPNSACTGASIEMIVEGGEIQFVSQLIDESVLSVNRSKIQWFSSMLGKLSSVAVIIEKLRTVGCDNYAVTDFRQGQRTKRWCVAWSWLGLRPKVTVARGIASIEKKLLPFPSEYDFEVPETDSSILRPKINSELGKLELEWKSLSDVEDRGMGRTWGGDVWSRKARRRKQKSANDDTQNANHEVDEDSKERNEPAMVFAISTRPSANQSDSLAVIVDVRWLQGHDVILFESFCGWLKRKLSQS